MKLAPAAATAEAVRGLPATGAAAIANRVMARLRWRRRIRPKPPEPGRGPAGATDTSYWEDPAFWLWMVH